MCSVFAGHGSQQVADRSHQRLRRSVSGQPGEHNCDPLHRCIVQLYAEVLLSCACATANTQADEILAKVIRYKGFAVKHFDELDDDSAARAQRAGLLQKPAAPQAPPDVENNTAAVVVVATTDSTTVPQAGEPLKVPTGDAPIQQIETEENAEMKQHKQHREVLKNWDETVNGPEGWVYRLNCILIFGVATSL
jgi:hypothetical protein